jgi:hypothetical protein
MIPGMGWLTPFTSLGQALSIPSPLVPQIEAWTTSQLESVVWSDIMGTGEPLPMTRAEAIMVPALARARHLTAGAIAGCPLTAWNGGARVDPTPSWAIATDGQLGTLPAPRRTALSLHAGQSPWWRMLWTIDDLIFYGASLWLVTQAAPDGRPLRMARLPWSTWSVDQDGRVTDADGRPFGDNELRVIPGPHEGLINFAQRTIREASTLETSAADIARRPFRVELHQTTDLELTDDERRELVSATRRALADNNGILFTNAAIETKDHAVDSHELLIDGRNASAVNIARVVSIPAAMIDATTAGASLTYETTEGRNAEWIDYGLSLYLNAIEARLSMDDVVASGTSIAFDTTDLTSLTVPATGQPKED